MTEAQHDDVAYQGRIDDGIHRYSLRIYFEDTDAGGVVYHANYLRFMERARTDMLRCVGIEQRQGLEAEGADKGNYVVGSLQIDYKRPAHLDDVVTVVSTVEAVRPASCIIRQRIVRKNEILTDARVTVAFVGEGGRPRRQPAAWREQFETLCRGEELQEEA
ncbi:tol-pal system-associated acyl-CoA thioesterase [Pedomonas mirosovicensis]|uniref:tol-pal system-associated acyl-CoA thioesterase n=1 Tax=Pedomonas mirosovicensis TaxID=2908641 RepID=UPI0021699FA2|nr:tol-pal system-associated acyl-CoA thioesterase [Pedomonas mirosovicensis]MCH8684718.1 tol-pal system-associated acyl-CoA thioesterase [Pedomonas mirosovicensis]